MMVLAKGQGPRSCHRCGLGCGARRRLWSWRAAAAETEGYDGAQGEPYNSHGEESSRLDGAVDMAIYARKRPASIQ